MAKITVTESEYQTNKGTTFRAQVRYKGQQVSKTFNNSRDRVLWVEQAKKDIQIDREHNITIAEILNGYLHSDDMDEKSETSRKADRSLIKVIRESHPISQKRILDLTKKDVIDYRDNFLKQKRANGKRYASSTKHHYLTMLKRAVDWYISDKEIYFNVFRAVKIPSAAPKVSRRKRVLNSDEITRLYKACNNEIMRFCINLTLQIGLRRREMAHVRKMDCLVYEHTPTLHVKDGKGESRIITLDDVTAMNIKEFLNKMSHLKDDERLYPYEPEYMYKYLKRIAKKADVIDVCWHDLRRTCIHNMFAERGYTVPQVMAVSGHQEPYTLMRYINVEEMGRSKLRNAFIEGHSDRDFKNIGPHF